VILVVGLGNPGPHYALTRHNAGFSAIDAFIATQAGERVAVFRPRFEGQYAELEVEGVPVALLKPETFMNASGSSVRSASSCLRIAPGAVLVIHDELDIPFGELRLKFGGGDAGHRGLRSISADLQSPGYGRLRVGIGRPPPNFQGDIADFVLQAFAPEERSELPSVLARASQVVRAVISDGLAETMNRTTQRTMR
jgi:peptidyl-tRNA hydrolase, PTH1 family